MKTLRISIKQAKPGMVSAEDIYTQNNQLVISKGTALTDKVITRLKFYQISTFYVVVEEPNQPDKKTPTVKDISYVQKTRQTKEFKQFNIALDRSIGELKSTLKGLMTSNNSIDTSDLLKHTTNILSKTRNGIHVFDMLHCIREYDDLTFAHSINVSLICNVFGHWLKLSDKDIEVLTLSGLLHDIGKLMMPSTIINKESVLTVDEYNIVKTHSIQGYEILKNKNIDPRIKSVALMHHERCDGSGYPKGLTGTEIEPFAKIVAIADVYDAMTSARVYRPARSPFEAISLFESEGLQKYDPHYIMTFLEEIIAAYVGNRVRLSNQLVGEIRMINRTALSKPIVQVGSKFIDLSKEKITIEAIL